MWRGKLLLVQMSMAEIDEHEGPVHHYHFWSTRGLVMRLVGPSSSLMWTSESGTTLSTKLGVGCVFNPRPVRGADSPYIQLQYEDDRMDRSNLGVVQEVDEHWFEAALPVKILNLIHTALTRGGVTQFMVSALFQWNAELGQKYGWVAEDFVMFTLEGADWAHMI